MSKLSSEVLGTEGKMMQEEMIHSMTQFANAWFHERTEGDIPNEWTVAVESTKAELLSQVSYMTEANPQSWSTQAWIDWVNMNSCS